MLYQLTVTLGRNVTPENVPMSLADWQDFKASVTQSVSYVIRQYAEDYEPALTRFLGNGMYRDTLEECCIIQVLHTNPLSKEGCEALQNDLVILKNRYQQDSVAVSMGFSELIFG